MPCNASYARFIFGKFFHKYYNLICTPICTKKFILVKSGCYRELLELELMEIDALDPP
jgi:hypothetical protein